ncbi:MAG: hypothetical protein DCC71_10695 [Proteobacteria bacterium]|nr:MAG: hypothetical protein DCC71_10695 [Pseudomonadota bacterium]
MSRESARALLRWTLLIGGVFLVFGLPFVMYAFPEGWRWEPYNTKYEHMILSIYAAMGVFYVLAWRAPERWGSFLWFTVAANAAHGIAMLADALHHPEERANLAGDVPVILFAAAAMALLAWRAGVPLRAPAA